MIVRTLFPCLLVLAFTLSLTASVSAQTNPNRPRYAVRKTVLVTARPRDNVAGKRETDADAAANTTTTSSSANSVGLHFHEQLLTALESHVGAPYHFNRTGPGSFDCSGLVWRAFQDIGIDFQRGPARSYWAMFTAPPAGEQFKFGTLVFFSRLRHVGIVVDDKGFYHSARHGGVMYSPFNNYWLSRIDGFRRVPLEDLPAIPTGKRQTKPTAVVPITDEGIPR